MDSRLISVFFVSVVFLIGPNALALNDMKYTITVIIVDKGNGKGEPFSYFKTNSLKRVEREGNLCRNPNGGSGICKFGQDCHSIAKLLNQGFRPTVCNFDGPVICCPTSSHHPVPSPNDGYSSGMKEQLHTTVNDYQSDESYNKGVHHSENMRPALIGESNNGYSPPLDQGPPHSNSPHKQITSLHGNHPGTSSNVPSHSIRPIYPKPSGYITSTPYEEERPSWEVKPSRPYSTTKKPWSGNSQKKRISKIMCEEYSQMVSETVAALPLVPNPEPISSTIENCDFVGVPLIVGGQKARLGEFPHMAALGFAGSNGEISYRCGGALISDEYVLTAAHCSEHVVYGGPVRVRLGELNMVRNDDGAAPQEYRVAEIIAHPQYSESSKYHDIALLRLSERIRFNKQIRPACLHHEIVLPANMTAIATGWGRIDFGGPQSKDLLKVQLNIIDNAHCNSLYQGTVGPRTTLPKGINGSFVCAGILSGGYDTCQGDSGGPLQIPSDSNQCVYHIVGITSFGKYCAMPDSPGVYTRVARYISWIERIVWP